MWLKYSFPLVAQILVPTWLKYSLTFTTDYLLGLTEQKNHSDVDVASLHLSDEVLELLRSGKINNRLLCEMMTHPRFR